MDSPRSDANNQIVPVSGVSSKSHEEPSVDQGGQSSESAVAAPPPPPAENYQLAIPEHDREYGCRYCDKKFSNKQALGGHQNAHKVERLMEKNMHEHRNSLDYFRSSSSSYHGRLGMAAGGPFLTSYNQRPSPYGWSCTAHHSGCAGVIPYSSRPLLPLPGAFPGWSPALPGPRLGPFPGRSHYTLPPAQNTNIRLPNFGAGSSNAFGQGMPGFPGLGVRPAGGNNGPNAPINLRNVPEVEQDEDSDVDLSLKL